MSSFVSRSVPVVGRGIRGTIIIIFKARTMTAIICYHHPLQSSSKKVINIYDRVRLLIDYIMRCAARETAKERRRRRNETISGKQRGVVGGSVREGEGCGGKWWC